MSRPIAIIAALAAAAALTACTSTSLTSPSPDSAIQRDCESFVNGVLDAQWTRAASDEDLARLTGALGAELPGTPDCTIAYDTPDGIVTTTVWRGDASVGEALVGTIAQRSLPVSRLQEAGYVATVFSDADTSFTISPIGEANLQSSWSTYSSDGFVTVLSADLR